jgi:hypothetical protein
MASNIDIAIRAKNEASGAIRQVSADLGNLDDAAAGVGGGFGDLGNLLTGGLIAGGLTVLADRAIAGAAAIYDLAKSAQAFDTLKSSFNDLAASAGESGDAMLTALRGASQGMIADQDLILAANRAMMLGVAQNSQQMVELLQVATVRGKAMGMSATDAFNDLVTGLGRMSPLILDNLGIVTGGEKVFEDYAKSLGTTSAALTDAQKKQALFAKVVAESQDLLSKPMDVNPFAKMDAQIANLKIKMGELALPLAGEFAQAASDAAGELSHIFDAVDVSGAKGWGEMAGYAVGVAIKDGIVSIMNGNGMEIAQSIFDAATMLSPARIGMEMAKGTYAAFEDNTATPDQARNDVVAQRAAIMDELTLKTQQYSIAMSDMLGTLDQYFALNAAGNTGAADVVYEQAMAKIELAKQLKAENETLAESYNQLGEAIGLTAKKMQGPSLDPGWADYTHAAKAATAATTEVGAAADGVSGGMTSAANAGFNFSYALDAISGSAGAVPGALAAAASAVNSIRAEMVNATIAGMAMADAMAVVQRYSGLEKSGQQIAQGLTNLGFYEPQQIAYAVDLNTQTALADVRNLAAEAGKVPEALKGPGAKTPDYGIDEIGRQVGRATGATEAYQDALSDSNDEQRAGTREAVKFGDTVVGSTSYGKQKTDELRGAFGELGAGVVDALGGAGGGGAAGAVDNLALSLDDLRGKVSSVLSGALTPDIGFDPSSILPREDDINENARRLAAIANEGIIGQPWLEEFKNTAPQAWSDIMAQVAAGVDAKTAAASIYRDFQSGLRPDLIDKGLVKERVKAMIIGDQNMAALAEEIAQELATEMGIPLQQALAAAGGAMGVSTGAAGDAAAEAAGTGGTDMTAGGAQAGQTWIAGFLANADGTAIVAGIVTKLSAEMPKFLEAGKGAGTQWGTGFMSTVESGIANPLITLLVTLVTPGIMAQIAAGKSQTEPPQ